MAQNKTAKNNISDVPVYVIAGKDEYRVNEACDNLLNLVIPVEQRAMGLWEPAPNLDPNIADVLDELRTLPFLGDRKVVLIRDADRFITQNRPSLERYFDHPSKIGTLILTVQTWTKSTKLAKKLPAIGELIDIEPLKGWQFAGYAADYMTKKHGKALDKPAAGLLVELVGDEIGRICSEADKLAVYVGDRKRVQTQDIQALVGRNRMVDAFGVIDTVMTGQAGAAVDRLRRMFASDRSAEFSIIGAFAFHIRRLFQARQMLDKGISSREAAKQLRIWYQQDAFFSQVSRLKIGTIGRMMAYLARTDYQVKTGQTSVSVAIEQMILHMASATQKR